jgi:GMP synthase-like glutamine amidotransferase
MRSAVDADVPVLGLCYGGQMLARVLGAEVSRSEDSEIGWLPVRSSDPELVPEGPWFQWHFDTFAAPPGATVIADSEVGTQAFVAGRSLGLQFHPEVTTEIMDEWVRVYRHELDADGVDPDALLDETYRRASENRRMGLQLLDRYLSDVAKLVPADGNATEGAGSGRASG